MGFNMTDLMFFVPMILIMYFLIFLPKRKEQQRYNKMMAGLKKGDRVVTNSGMHGEVWAIRDAIVTLKFHDNVRIDFSKSAISAPIEDKPAVEKKEEKEKAVEAKA